MFQKYYLCQTFSTKLAVYLGTAIMCSQQNELVIINVGTAGNLNLLQEKENCILTYLVHINKHSFHK